MKPWVAVFVLVSSVCANAIGDASVGTTNSLELTRQLYADAHCVHGTLTLSILAEMRAGRHQHALELLERQLDVAVIAVAGNEKMGALDLGEGEGFLHQAQSYRASFPERPKTDVGHLEHDQWMRRMSGIQQERAAGILRGINETSKTGGR